MAKTQTELKSERDAEGRAIARDVQAQLDRIEGKIDAQNEKWLREGDAGVIGAGAPKKSKK